MSDLCAASVFAGILAGGFLASVVMFLWLEYWTRTGKIDWQRSKGPMIKKPVEWLDLDEESP